MKVDTVKANGLENRQVHRHLRQIEKPNRQPDAMDNRTDDNMDYKVDF